MVGYVEMVEGRGGISTERKVVYKSVAAENMSLEFKWGNLGNGTVNNNSRVLSPDLCSTSKNQREINGDFTF